MHRSWIVSAALAASASVAYANDGVRLVEVLSPRTFERGSHELSFPAVVAPGARYFLTLQRDGALGRVELNGAVVLGPDDLVRPGGELVRVEVPLGATNQLRVKVTGKRDLTLAVHGLVPASALPAGAGRRVAQATLYRESFDGGLPPRVHTRQVHPVTDQGLFSLRVEQSGATPAITALVLWNGQPALGVLPILPGRPSVEGAVAARATNALKTSVLGTRSSRVTVTLSGWIVDESAPVVAWSPLPAELEPTTALRVGYSDALSGIADGGVRIVLDGAHDVTAAFAVGPAEATSTLAALEALAPSSASGAHTLTAVVTDRGGLSAEASLTFTRDRTPPALVTPGDLAVEQTSPAGAVVTFDVTASDETDPAPVVECAPPSGSLFPAGTTTVTCTARDASGNATTATFLVTVQDTQPPTLVLTPPDGALVTIDRVPVRVTFADPGSGVDPATIAVTLDGAPLPLTIGDGEATALTPPLADGEHVLVATLADRAGHAAGASSTLDVALPDLVAADHLALPAARANGGSSTATLLVSNASDRVPLHLRGAVATGDFALDPPLPFGGLMLLPGGSVELVVRSSPSAVGARAGTLALESNDPTEPVHVVALAGEGTHGALELTLDPGPTTALPAGSLQRLRLRAVDFAGATDLGFRGLVELRTTPVDSPLDGMLVWFGDAEQGLFVTDPLPLFTSVGPASISARLLVDAAPFELGSLALEVVRVDRGRVFAVVDSGGYVPGQVIRARIFVDMGPSDGSPTALADTLGAYDLRLLFDHRQLEVVGVDAGSSPLGAPTFVLPGSLRLMDLNDLGTLTAPQGPDPSATGELEVASVRLRVRDGAPSGPVPVHVVADALTTAEPASPALRLSPAGDPGPRLGEVQGSAVIVAGPAPDALIALGTLPRPGEGLVDGLQTVDEVRALLSAPVDPTSLGAVTLLRGAEVVTGVARVGDLPTEVVFTPDVALEPGEYALRLDAGLAALDGTNLGAPRLSAFRVGPDLDPLPADLDHDGELAVLDVQARRDVVAGRTPGQVPDFPPLFLQGGPGAVSLSEGRATTVIVELVDLEGMDVFLDPAGLPDFAFVSRLSQTQFALFVEAQAAGSGSGGTITLTGQAGGAFQQVQLTLDVENVNAPPTLTLVDPTHGRLVVVEDETLELAVEASDPDLLDASFPDQLTFRVTSPAVRNLEGPVLSGEHQERAAFTFMPDFDQAGLHELTLEVTDRKGARAVLPLVLDVRDANRSPELMLVQPEDPDPFVAPGDQVTIAFEAADPEGLAVAIGLAGPGEQDLARLVAEGTLRVDQRVSAPGQLAITLTVLAPLTRNLVLEALASDGYSFGGSLRVTLRDGRPLSIPAEVSLFHQANPTSQVFRTTTGFDVTLRAEGAFLAGNQNTQPDAVWLEQHGVRVQLPQFQWFRSSDKVLRITTIHFPITAELDDGLLRYDLAVETAVQGPAGEERVVRRGPIVFVDGQPTSAGNVSFQVVTPNTGQQEQLSHKVTRDVTVFTEGLYVIEGTFGWNSFNGTTVFQSASVRFAGETLVQVAQQVSNLPVRHELFLPVGTHTIEVEASWSQTSNGNPLISLLGVAFTGVVVFPAPPEYTLLEGATAGIDDTYAYAVVRIEQPRAFRGFTAVGGGRVVAQHALGPVNDLDDPRQVALLLELPRFASQLRLTAAGLTASNPLVIQAPETQAGSRRADQHGFYRAEVAPETSGGYALARAFSATLLPEGQRAADQPLDADDPYALYYVFGATGLDPADLAVWGSLTSGLPTPFQPLSMRQGGPLPLELFDGSLTDRYWVSPPIFLELRAQAPGTLSPIQVLPDRIVVSVGAPEFEGERDGVPPRTFPLPGGVDAALEATFELLLRGHPTGQVAQPDAVTDVIAPGLLKRGCDCHEGEENEPEPLAGALVECGDTIEAWTPQLETGRFRLYLDDDDEAPLVELPGFWNEQTLVYEVSSLMAEVPQLTPGVHRVRVYPTLPEGASRSSEAALFEATFTLVTTTPAMVFKTALGQQPPVHCDGATPGDAAQRLVKQGDFPLDDDTAPCTPVAGGRVLLNTGEEALDIVDLRIPGRGMDFVLTRTYRSRIWYHSALGHSWTFNWNESLFFEPNGDVVRQNGKARLSYWKRLDEARFETPPGHFAQLVRRPGFYLLREPDGTKRRYDVGGALISVEDRHGNRIELIHEHGQLVRIVDTLERTIDFEYTVVADPVKGGTIHRLTKVKDFSGREVEYVYDLATGDLAEVRAPTTTGARRVEKYTYWSFPTSDEEDPRYQLNHNLKSVTTPAGDVVHTLTYGIDPQDALTFDKVIKEVVGDGNEVGGERTFTYRKAAADPRLVDEDVEVEVKEPNGNVHIHVLDTAGREIALRQKTRGLRDPEPVWFETRSTYNADGLLARRTYPEENFDEFSYGATSRAAARNVISHRRSPGPRGQGKLPNLLTLFTYEPVYNRLIEVTDPRKHASSFKSPLQSDDAGRYVTRFFVDYQEHSEPIPDASEFGITIPTSIERGKGDLNGDGVTDGSRGDVVLTVMPTVTLEQPRDGSSKQEVKIATQWNAHGQVVATKDPEGNVTKYEYHASGAQRGYRSKEIVDAERLALTTTYAYDVRGNLTEVVNPRGVTTKFTFNALNEVTKVTRGAQLALASDDPAVNESPLALEATHEYDLNGRLERTLVELGATRGVTLERRFTYDVLGDVRESHVQVDASTTLVTRYGYDRNRNLTEVTAPEGNRLVTRYDERDMVFTVTRGADTPEASTVRVDYDRNGNRARVTDGRQNVTTFTYDGFDRLSARTDAFAGRVENEYDPVGNLVRTKFFGHEPGKPGETPVLLADVSISHDELNRPFRTDAALFLASGFTAQNPVLHDQDGDGKVTTRTEFDALSRPVRQVEDDGEAMTTRYDGAGRVVETLDAGGNRVAREYDRNGNLRRVTSTEVATGGVVPARAFSVDYTYDQLDRLLKTTDGAGQTTELEYDRRGNVVARVDGEGNRVEYEHDGLDRLLAETRKLYVGGKGPDGALDVTNPTNQDGLIKVRFEHDGNGRLKRITDDAGNKTAFDYDPLDRKVTQKSAEGTPEEAAYTFVYDQNGNVIRTTDPNGTFVVNTYDELDRLVSRTVSRGPGVSGAVVESYAYDGLSRLASATSFTSSTEQETCEWVYDSLGRVLEERQNGRRVRSQYSGDGKRTALLTAARSLAWTHDALDRPTQVKDGVDPGAPTIAAFTWAGGLRELTRTHQNGTVGTFLDVDGDDGGYDDVQRVVRLRHLLAGGAAFVDRQYGYNAASMRTSERRNDDAGRTDRYTYDSAYRIVSSTFEEGPGGVSAATYRLDGVGNRRQVTRTTTGTTTQTYAVNALNEYTQVGADTLKYDENGNLLEDATRVLTYDFQDRLVGVAVKSGGTIVAVAAYRYLPDGRRTHSIVGDSSGTLERRFLWDGPQEIEEHTAQGEAVATYVWAPGYVDDLLQFQRTGAHPLGAATFHVHQDARHDVVAITDVMGQVVERRKYDDYGAMEVRDAAGQVQPRSVVGLAYGFQGRRLEPESGLYHFRARHYDPGLGRFLQRDPVWDPTNAGNQYTFAGNNPTSLMDPSGEAVPIILGMAAYSLAKGALIGAGIGATSMAIADTVARVQTGAGWAPDEMTYEVVGKAAKIGALGGAAGAAGTLLAGSVIQGTILASALGSAGPYVALAAGGYASTVAVDAAEGTTSSAGMYAFNIGFGPALRAIGAIAKGGIAAARHHAATKAQSPRTDHGGCFLAGTLVETERGRVAIEDVRAGDRVLSRDEHTGEQGYRSVVRLFRGHTDTVVYLRVAERPAHQRGRGERHRVGEGSAGAEAEDPDLAQTLRCTTEHPFWVDGRGWLRAEALRVGDRLVGARGEELVVVGHELRHEEADHFNFEVEGWHTYFVAGERSAPAVWVHNACRIIDNNTLSSLADGDAAAVRFAHRNRGELYFTAEIRQEFLNSGRTMKEFQQVAGRFHLSRVSSATSSEIEAVMTTLNVTSAARRTDMSLIAAAERHGMGLVTGDQRLFSAALRHRPIANSQLQYRQFDNLPWQRVQAYEAVRQNIIPNQRRGVSPHIFTGSPIGR